MHAATPIPRAPTILTLDTPAALLTGPGCPVCRYADEASDRYFAWFALESHARADTITRLCASLGMCPPHTRSLIRQPGAEIRLTAVYRYLMRAARDRLAGPPARLDRCPACDHDSEVVARAVDTLIEGVADNRIRTRYRELGGLCIPHLRTALARGNRLSAAWLSDTLMAAVDIGPASLAGLVGTDRDTPERAVLRQAARASAPPGSQTCAGCLAAVRSESKYLSDLLRTRDRAYQDGGLLCASHLNDLAALAGQPAEAALLVWQAGCLTASPDRARRPPCRARGGTAGWLRSRRRRAAAPRRCPACLTAEDAARHAIGDLRSWLHPARQVPIYDVPLCVRHLLVFSSVAPSDGRVTRSGGIKRAEMLAAELDEAFSKNTWARRGDAQGPEMMAWRRAVSFLDGGVFCGSAARQTLFSAAHTILAAGLPDRRRRAHCGVRARPARLIW